MDDKQHFAEEPFDRVDAELLVESVSPDLLHVIEVGLQFMMDALDRVQWPPLPSRFAVLVK